MLLVNYKLVVAFPWGYIIRVMANRKQLKNILKSKKALTITSAINFFTQNSNNQPNASERYEKLT
jgi:hypothetical protein